MRSLFTIILITCIFSTITPADTNIHILGEIILKKNQRLYIDKGRIDGVEIGHKTEILYDGQKYGNTIVSWVGDDICYVRVDSLAFYRYSFFNPLEVKIYLEKPLKYEGGVLHVPYYQEMNLEPANIYTPDDKTLACLIYDGLVRTDEHGNITLALAHSWEKHGNTYTFYLNTDIKFHSGKPFDAHDVAYSLIKLAQASKVTPSSSFILEIDGYEEVHYGRRNELRGVFIPNKYTIAITTKDTFSPFLKYLAGPGGYIIPAVKSSQTLPVPIGTGPFAVSHAGSNKISLTVNEDYFDAKPVLDSIIFIQYNNRAEAALDFELGKLDLIYFDSQDESDLLTNGNYISRRYYTSSTVMLGFNCKHSYQKNYELAKALQYLFNKENIVRILLGNSAQKSDGIIPPELSLDSGSKFSHYYSPSEVKVKVSEIENLPKKLNLVYDKLDPVLESIAGYIAGQLRQIDIKTSVKSADIRDLEQAVKISSMDIYLFRYDLPIADPDAFFYPLLSRELNGQTNYLYYNNPQLEKYIETARRLDDEFTRNDIYLEVEKILIQEPPLITLYNPIMTVVYKRDLAGFKPDARSYINLHHTYFQAGK